MPEPTVELDPITFEVVKHRLWQINDEAGTAIRTISTSPIVVEGTDFNVGLFTAEGDLAFAGPGVLLHVTTMDAVIKNVIARVRDPQDGDMFLVNDPYLGALHQNDVAVVSPVFHDGELVLWVGNVIHHADLGGSDEGSFCINATSVYQEPARYFLQVARRGAVAPDVERTFSSNSRLPDMVALDLRAQIGAINVARRRLHEVLDEIGPDTVRAVMARTIDFAEQRLRERLAGLRDGVWSTDVYMDGDRVGSDRIIRVHVRLEKRGDELFFDYSGTDPQSQGAVNATWFACYAGSTAPIYTFLCGSQIDWNSSMKRCVHVEAPEGTVMNARFPAAVSICSIGFAWLATVAAGKVLARMFADSPGYEDLVCPSWGVSCNGNNLFARNHKGKAVGALLSDHRGCGAAARSFADGIDHAGMIFSPLSLMADVESQEWKLPLLYAFRRRLPDSGGPGRYRGGLTVLNALLPYRTDRVIWKSQNTAGSDQSNAAGILGGYPGAGSQVSVVRNSRSWDLLRVGARLTTFEDFGGVVEHLPTKSEGVLGPDDVFLFYPPGGGGYGDPLLREAERVRRDVLDGAVTRAAAASHYGVVLDEGLAVDEAATRAERDRRLEARRSMAAGGESWDGAEATPTHSRPLHCPACGVESPGGAVLRWTASLAEAGPWLALRWQGESPNFRLAHTACPACGVLVDVDEVRYAGPDA